MTAATVINIGWARAASTAFRRNFLRRHPQILVVDRGQAPAEGPGASLLLEIKGADEETFARHSATWRAEWQAFEQRNRSGAICVTDEELSIGLPGTRVSPATIGTRCGIVFPGARTLAIIRDQVEGIRSFYALAQRGGSSALPLSEWVQRYFLSPKPEEDFTALFSYTRTLRSYLAWQARADILVVPYDRLKSDHLATYVEVARWMGISEEPCRLFPNEIVNASPASSTSPTERGEHARQPAQDEYAAGQAEQIRSLYGEDNEALASEFGIVFPR